MSKIDTIMAAAPVIPVLVIDDVDDALPIGRALVAGGLRVLEVTLRTPAAPEAIRRMRGIDGAIVGAGTVLNSTDVARAADAGAGFLISPGLTGAVARAADAAGLPYLPGVGTASDVMRGLDLGMTRFKFFPAGAAGGTAMLRALGGPFGGVRFCPTGGVTPDNAREYLSLPNVACVGGTWLAPAASIAAKDWGAIEELARAASALRP